MTIWSAILLFLVFIKLMATPVHWVPIVDRNSDDTSDDPIEVAFRKTKHMDQIHQEKVVRIGKMLNGSLETQESVIKEGNRKLEDLRHAGYSSYSAFGHYASWQLIMGTSAILRCLF